MLQDFWGSLPDEVAEIVYTQLWEVLDWERTWRTVHRAMASTSKTNFSQALLQSIGKRHASFVCSDARTVRFLQNSLKVCPLCRCVTDAVGFAIGHA
jgi:hypothetical protein